MTLKKPPEPKLSITPEVALGNNVNHFRVTTSGVEFFLEFAKVMPGLEVTPITNRLILTPFGLKIMAELMQRTLIEYEAKYGKIKDVRDVISLNVDTSIAN